MWFSDRKDLIDAMSISPAYLRNQASESGSVIDYRDWQVPLGRRFRSLKLWFVLRMFGASGLRTHIRKDVSLAAMFEHDLLKSPLFELVVPRFLSLVCFRLKPSLLASIPADEVPAKTNALNKTLADRINARTDIFITASEIRAKPEKTGPDGKPQMVYFLRVVVGGRSREEHLRKAWEIVDSVAREVCAEAGIKI